MAPMTSPPASRIDCFNQGLPVLGVDTTTYKSVKPSSESTSKAKPPLILRHVPSKHFWDLADNTLRAPTFTNHCQSNSPIATTFSKLPLESESDVVYASLLYAISPIMEILQVLYPDQWTMYTELNDRGEILENPGTNGTEAVVRYDLIFKTTAGHLNPGKTIAMIEYKRRGLIRYDDFMEVIVSDDALPAEINKVKIDSQNRSRSLKTNGMSYSKQVCRYAQTSKCKHVALFNWQHLVLFDFHRLNSGTDKANRNKGESFTAGDEAKMSWVYERGAREGVMEPGSIRKALLGWLLQAFNDCGSQ